jgi:hypothetical protein
MLQVRIGSLRSAESKSWKSDLEEREKSVEERRFSAASNV